MGTTACNAASRVREKTQQICMIQDGFMRHCAHQVRSGIVLQRRLVIALNPVSEHL